MTLIVRFTLTTLLSVFAVGCANQSSVASSNAGTTKVFKYPYSEVNPAALETVQGLNVELKGTKPEGDGTRILFSKPVSAWSWGEVGSVVVKPIDENATLVTVDTEKRYQIQVTGTGEVEFSEAIFMGIEEVLTRE